MADWWEQFPVAGESGGGTATAEGNWWEQYAPAETIEPSAVPEVKAETPPKAAEDYTAIYQGIKANQPLGESPSDAYQRNIKLAADMDQGNRGAITGSAPYRVAEDIVSASASAIANPLLSAENALGIDAAGDMLGQRQAQYDISHNRDMGYVQKTAGGIGESIAEYATLAAAGGGLGSALGLGKWGAKALKWATVGAGTGNKSYEDTYRSSINSGKNEDEAQKIALATAAVEVGVMAAFQKAGLGGAEGAIVDGLGIGAAKGSAKKLSLQGAKKFFTQTAGELAEEEITTFAQTMAQEGNPGGPKAYLDTAVQTLGTMGLLSGSQKLINFTTSPSRKTAKEAGVDEIATNHKERVQLATKFKNGLTAAQFEEQLRAASTSPEEADALLGLYRARAESAGESFDDYVGKRIKGVEKTTSDQSVYLAQRQSGKPDALAQPAYHGSPYKFDKFTTDAMGTGEGQQAYGWGLYFAGNEAVAKYYREALSSPARSVQKKAMEEYDQGVDPQEAADLLFARTDLSPIERKLLESLRDNDWLGFDYPHQAVKAAMTKDFASRFDPTPELVAVVEDAKKRSGALYKVNLKPEEHEYLDWDKPLHQQSPQVMEALSALFGDDFSLADISGGSAYHRLMDMVDDDRESRGAKIGSVVDAKKAVSRMLNAHGVRGIKYFDGASRKRGEGHRNYVIFDDADVVIEEVLAQKQGAKPRGEIQFLKDEGTAIIRAFEGQNLSTLLHETGHLFRRDLAGEDLKIAERWAGARNGKWDRKAEEKFARGFENYLATGKSPTPALSRVFAKFKTWLTNIYGAIKGTAIDVNISPEMRTVFDRLLTPAETNTQTQGATNGQVQTQGRTEGQVEWTAKQRILYDDLKSQFGKTYSDAQLREIVSKDLPLPDGYEPDVEDYVAPARDREYETLRAAGYSEDQMSRMSADDVRAFAGDLETAQFLTETPANRTPDILSQDLADRFRGLANQTTIPEARAANYEADVAMGMPERKTWAEAEQKAAQRIQADPTGELSRVIQRIDQANATGGVIQLENQEETALVNRLSDMLATDLSTPEARTLHRKLRFAFRSARSEQARALGYRDPLAVMDPEQRKRTAITEAIAEPTPEEAQARKDARTPEQHAEVDRRMEERYNAAKDALAKQGIDLDDIDSIVADPKKAMVVFDHLRPATSRWDAAYEYWRNAILSGPTTQSTNIIGNTVFGAWNLGPERLAEAAVNLFARNKKAATFGEFKYLLGGVLPGIVRGARNARTSWSLETSALAEELGRDGAFKVDGPRGAIKGRRGRLIRAMGYRPLLAADEFAKSVVVTMEVGARAYRHGVELGLKGNELQTFIQQQTDDLGSVAWSEAFAKAEELTFQGNRGLIAQNLTKGGHGIRKFKGARWVLPFVDTPAAIFEQGIKRTPGLGAILDYAESRRSGMNMVDAGMTPTLARQLIAFGGLALLWGAVSGDDPWLTGADTIADQKNRDVSYRARPPMSVRVGDQWYSYARIEPFATAIAMTADAVKGIQGGKYYRPFTGLLQQAKEKSYLDGLGDAIDAVQEIGTGDTGALEQYGSKFAASWVPNLYRQTVRSAAGEMNENRMWGSGEDRFNRFLNRTGQQAGIPLLDTQPRYDIWGRPISYNDMGNSPATSFAFRLMSPVKSRDLSTVEQADLALIRWNEKHPDDQEVYSEPAKYVAINDKTQYLTDEQHAQYAELSGKLAQGMVSGLIFDPVNPTAQQIRNIKSAIAKARKMARAQLMPTWTFD